VVDSKGEVMGLKDLYYKLEDKYYASLDWFDSKGLPFYKVDDWFQSKGIPTFPFVLILTLIVLILIVYFALVGFGVVGPEKINVTLKFVEQPTNMLATNLTVVLTVDGEVLSKTTDMVGEVSFVAYKNNPVEISLPSPYSSDSYSVVFDSDGQKKTITITNSSAKYLSKTFTLLTNAETKALFDGEGNVTLTCDGISYEKTVSVAGGTFSLNDIPEECGLMKVYSSDLDIEATVDTSITAPELLVGSASGATGSLTVVCVDKNGAPLSNISVLVSNKDDVSVDSGVTSGSGTVSFDVPVGKYYISASDLTGVYGSVITKDQGDEFFFDDVLENQEKVITLTFNKEIVGKIVLDVTDVSGEAVSGGAVTLYKNNVVVPSSATLDINGNFSYNASEMIAYRVVIEHPQYMTYEKSGLLPSDPAVPVKITLSPATSTPTYYVKVIGSDKEPVQNASVQLFKKEISAGENPLLLTKTTDFEGVAEFRQLQAGVTYYAKVIKGDYVAQTADVILSEKTKNESTVVLNIKNGDVQVSVLDASGSPVSGANVEFFDAVSNVPVGVTQVTSIDGLAIVSTRADRTVYAKISKDGFADFYTLSTSADYTATNVLNGYLLVVPSALSIDLIDVQDLAGNSVNVQPLQALPGTEYKAVFLLRVPEGQAYDSANILLRADDVKTLTQSSLYISEMKVLNGIFEKGITFTDPNGFANDMTNKTTDKGLWGSLKLDKVNNGIYYVEVVFGVVNSPVKNTLTMSYRADLKKGSSYVRDPVDTELGQTATTTEKHGFYADSKLVSIIVGNSVCSNVFCGEFKVTEQNGNSTGISDSFEAVANTKYTFNVVNLISVTNRVFEGAKFELYSVNGALDLSNPSFTVNGKSVQTTGGSKKVVLDIGNVTKGIQIKGKVDFMISKEGDIPVVLKITGKDGEELYNRTMTFTVQPSKEMLVSIVPSIIVPFVNNAMLVVANDAETPELPITDGVVVVKNNDAVVARGALDFEGKFGFELPKPNVSDVVEITVSSPGYKTIIKTITVGENILITVPPEINLTIDRSTADYVSSNILLQNITPLKLKITGFRLANGDYSDFVAFDFGTDYVGKIIDSNLDINFSASLTREGKALLSPKTFSTYLFVDVTSVSGSETWRVKIPVSVYIKLYDALDSKDCLLLIPITQTEEDVWHAVLTASGETKEQEYVITNNCTFNGNPVVLYKPEINVLWGGKVLGKFKIGEFALDRNTKMFADELRSGDTSVVISFTGDGTTISEQSKATLQLVGYYPTNTGLQNIDAKSAVDVIISDLTKCIEIIAGPTGIINGFNVNNIPAITLGVNPNGLGYGMYNGYMGQNPYGMLSNVYNQYGTGILPTGSGYPQMYPDNYNYYAALYQKTGQDPTQQYNFNPALMGQNPNTYMQGYLGVGNNNLGSGLGYGMQVPGQLMMLPPVSALDIKNKCKFPVNMYFRGSPQIQIDATNLELATGATQKVTVSSTMNVGNFVLNIMGAYGTDTTTVPIVNIPIVVVDLEAEGITDDCFKLSENPINMSSFYNDIKQMKVYNYCYMTGVAFGSPAVAEQNLMVTQKELDEIMNGGVVVPNGEAPYVNATAYAPNVKNDETHGRYQVVDVFLKKDPSIQRGDRLGPTGTDNLSDLVSKTSNLRVSTVKQYKSIVFPAVFIVNARMGVGANAMTQQKTIFVKVIDNWNWLGFVDVFEDILELGNPNCKPQLWQNYLNYTADKEITTELNSNEFSKGSARVPYGGSYNAFMQTETKYCFGSSDSIIFTNKSGQETIDKLFLITPHSSNGGRFYFDVDALKEIPARNYNYKLKFKYLIKSYQFPDADPQYSEQYITLNLTIRAQDAITSSNTQGTETAENKKEELSEEDGFKAELCKKALGNTAALLSEYKKTNPLISFDYSNKITCDAFSEDGKLCDAQQFALSVTNTPYEYASNNKFITNSKTHPKDLGTIITETYDLPIGDVLLKEDKEELLTKIEAFITKSQFDVGAYSTMINAINAKLKSYNNNKESMWKLYFVTADEKSNLEAKPDLSEDNAKNFFTNNDIQNYNLVFRLSNSNISALSLLDKYYLAKALSNGKKHPEEFGYYMVNLKHEGLNDEDAINEVWETFLTNVTIKIESGYSAGQGNKTGVYVLHFNSVTNSINNYNIENSLVKEINEKDFLYKLVFDPWEKEPKNYGYCLTGGKYAVYGIGDSIPEMTTHVSAKCNGVFNGEQKTIETEEKKQVYYLKFKSDRIFTPEEIKYVGLVKGEFTLEKNTLSNDLENISFEGSEYKIVYADDDTSIKPTTKITVYGKSKSDITETTAASSIFSTINTHITDIFTDTTKNYCVSAIADDVTIAMLPEAITKLVDDATEQK